MERDSKGLSLFRSTSAAGDAELDVATTLLMKPGAQPAVTVRSPDPQLFDARRDERIDRYVLLHCLGQGGMGAVYAAWDPQLGRQVALKLLHTDDTAGSQDRARLRLQREAQAIAQLSHPHVVAVYDVGSHGGELFVAMELVDGGTLRTWLSQRRRSWREILDLFLAAGRGLEAAHAAGLVHRDFKPDNVLVGKDGRVRVADFGLARAVGGAISSDDDEPSPVPPTEALSFPLTHTGALVGTPVYMAPEQFHGGAVDARTDQFSFCVALYRALYGVLPFGDGPVQELAPRVMAGKLSPPLRKTRVPTWIASVLTRGLKANPEDRFPSMEALLVALDPRPRARRRFLLLGGALAAALLVVGGTLALGHRVSRPGRVEAAQPRRIPQHRKLTTAGDVTESSLSPDGRTLAYVSGGRRLVLRNLETDEEREVFRANRIVRTTWSPSSTELLIYVEADAEKSGCWLWSRAGVRRIAVGYVAAWSPDGLEIAHASQLERDIHVLRWKEGKTKTFPLRGTYSAIKEMDWSPDGARLLVGTVSDARSTLWSVRTDGSHQEFVVEDETLWSLRWSRQGRSIYYLQKHQDGMDLMRARLDPLSDRVVARPTVILSGLDTQSRFSINGDGKDLVYTKTQQHANLWLMDVDQRGLERVARTMRLSAGTSNKRWPALSPDGKTVAFRASAGGTQNLFTLPVTGGPERQLTFFRSWDSRIGPPAWSPDGQEIAFATGEGGAVRIWRVPATGGSPRPFPRSLAGETRFIAWAPGAEIFYVGQDNQHYRVLDPRTGAERSLLDEGALSFIVPPLYSPDGQRVMFSGTRREGTMVWLLSVKDGSVTPLEAASQMRVPLGWSADGQWVYVEQETTGDDEVIRLPAAGGPSEHWVTLPIGQNSGCASMTADAQRYACLIMEGEADAWLVEDFDDGLSDEL